MPAGFDSKQNVSSKIVACAATLPRWVSAIVLVWRGGDPWQAHRQPVEIASGYRTSRSRSALPSPDTSRSRLEYFECASSSLRRDSPRHRAARQAPIWRQLRLRQDGFFRALAKRMSPARQAPSPYQSLPPNHAIDTTDVRLRRHEHFVHVCKACGSRRRRANRQVSQENPNETERTLRRLCHDNTFICSSVSIAVMISFHLRKHSGPQDVDRVGSQRARQYSGERLARRISESFVACVILILHVCCSLSFGFTFGFWCVLGSSYRAAFVTRS